MFSKFLLKYYFASSMFILCKSCIVIFLGNDLWFSESKDHLYPSSFPSFFRINL